MTHVEHGILSSFMFGPLNVLVLLLTDEAHNDCVLFDYVINTSSVDTCVSENVHSPRTYDLVHVSSTGVFILACVV